MSQREDKAIGIHALGGIDSIGASAALATIDDVNVLFDCGMNAGRVDDPFPQALKRLPIDIVLLSHAHVDHVGALPVVIKSHPGVPVFATAPTKKLAKVMLRDAALHIPRERPDHYSQRDAEAAADLITEVKFEESFRFRDLVIKFRNAGHILGAATIIVQGSSTLVYTGDFSVNPTSLTPGASIPETPEPCDLLFSETTYGVRESGPRQDQELLTEVVQVLSGQGRVLIPSFALGRAQEVLVLLSRAMSQGKLQKASIYLDGLVRQVNEVYLGLPDYVADSSALAILRDYELLKPVQSMEKRLEILFGNEPCIIVASSGMLTGGWSPIYAKDFVSRKDSAIFFVGYLDEDSPGRALKELASGRVVLDNDEMKVRCKVRAFNLSAHADRQGIIRLDSLYPPKVFVPVHGNQNGRHSVGTAVSDATKCLSVYPYNGQSFSVYPDSRRYALQRTEEDQSSVDFLESMKGLEEPSADTIADRLASYLKERRMTDFPTAERFMWEVFKNSANYVSADPWTTVSERSKFFHACESVLEDRFVSKERVLTRSFERSSSSFLANLVLYGVNLAWAGLVRKVEVQTLEEAEALLVQLWTNFEFKRPTILDVYHKCRIRVEWPAGNEYEDKFKRLFSKIELTLELLESLEGIDFLVSGDAVIGAVKDEVVLVMLMPPASGPAASRDLSQVVSALSESRLIRLAGWKVDTSKVRPVVLPRSAGSEGIALTDELRGVLSRAVEPFRAKTGEGVLALFSDVPDAMRREGFIVEVKQRYLVATHRESGKKMLVVPDQNGERFADYNSEPGFIMRIPEFKKAVGRINTVWRPKAEIDLVKDSNGLAVEVITPYNWHAHLPVEERRKALEDSLDAYELDRLIRTLRVLRDYTFTNKPDLAKVVREDLEWLEKTFGANRTATRLAFEREALSHVGLIFTKARFDRIVVLAT